MKGSPENAAIKIMEKLVEENVIIYGPHQVVKHEDEGYPIEFRICPALLTKPHTVGATLSPAFDRTHKWGPGSDMYCPDKRLILHKFNGTHDVALNLFCVDRPQLLILTLDSYQRQHEALNLDDVKVALEVLQRFPNMYVMYNCGEAGGCSRVHKHLQALRGPPHAFDLLIDDDTPDIVKAPFQYFTYHFQRGFSNAPASEVLQVYNTLLGKSRTVLEIGDMYPCPHNLVLWNNWIIMIPRSKGTVGGLSTNTAGMMGSIWVPEPKDVHEWLKAGCAKVMRGLGVPS